MSAEKTCPGAPFRYFSHCEACHWSEPIKVSIAAAWPVCDVCGQPMAVYAIGAALPLRLAPIHDPAGTDFIQRRAEKFLGFGESP